VKKVSSTIPVTLYSGTKHQMPVSRDKLRKGAWRQVQSLCQTLPHHLPGSLIPITSSHSLLYLRRDLTP
jgi:hypothetical protein